MKSEAETFDPEVMQLLREVVADPRSTLTRIPTEKLERWIGRPDETISPHGSYLTKAEKHLVQAYREKAAWVLVHACIEMLVSGHSLVFSPTRVTPERIRIQAVRLKKCKELDQSALNLLDSIAASAWPRPSQLSAAALSLAPTEQSRNCLALSLIREGDSTGALRLLGSILASRPSAKFRVLAWENSALVHASRFDYARALQCNLRANQVSADYSPAFLWRMTMALQLGDERAAIEAARRLEERFEHLEELRSLVNEVSKAREVGNWTPSRESTRLVPRLRDRLSEGGQSVCDAFA